MQTSNILHILTSNSVKPVKSCLVLSFLILIGGSLVAQTILTRKPVTDGREYVVCFHSAARLSSEPPGGVEAYIELMSTYPARVQIKSASDTSDAQAVNVTVQLEPNKLFLYRTPPEYANLGSAEIRDLAIRVSSNVPINVSSILITPSTSERVRHIPVGWWGTRYRTANYWLDEVDDNGANTVVQGNLIVLSNQDSTVVTVTPSVDIQSGPSVPSIPKNTVRSFTLMRGQIVVLKTLPSAQGLRTMDSDLGGSLVTSNVPIGVISGHDLVATQRFVTSISNVPSASIRNALAEAMIPTSLYSTEFVTAPLYVPKQSDQEAPPPLSMDNEMGDVVMVIADVAETKVERRGQNGVWTLLGELSQGEALRVANVNAPAQWRTSHPAMMVQYTVSKAYTGATTSNVKRVKPAMAMVAGTDRWVPIHLLASTAGSQSAVTVVVPTTRTTSIEIDGTVMVGMNGLVDRVIPATAYSMLQLEVPPGFHRVASNNGTNFNVIENAANEVLAFMPALSTASFAGFNYASNASGDLFLDTLKNECSKKFTMTTTGNTKLVDFYWILSENADVVITDSSEVSVTYEVSAISRKRTGRMTIVGRCDNGTELEHTVTFPSDLLQVENTDNIIADIPVGDTVSASVELENLNDEPITVSDITILNNNGNHSIWTEKRSMVVPGKSTVNVVFLLSGKLPGVFFDSVHFETLCSRSVSVQLRGKIVGPSILASEKSWMTSPHNQWTARWVGVTNPGSVVLKIRSITFEDVDTSRHFRYEEGLSPLPFTLQPGELREFKMAFNPRGIPDSTFIAKVMFHSTATVGDSVSVLTGVSGPGTGLSVSDYPDLTRQRTVHYLKSGNPLTIENMESYVSYSLFDFLGRLSCESDIQQNYVTIPHDCFPHRGLHMLRLTGVGGQGRELFIYVQD